MEKVQKHPLKHNFFVFTILNFSLFSYFCILLEILFTFFVCLCTASFPFTHISQECLHGFYERLKELLCNRKDSFPVPLGTRNLFSSHVTYISCKCDVEQSFKPLHHWIIRYENESEKMETLNCF